MPEEAAAGRRRARRGASTASKEWTELQTRFTWDDQESYELVRPVLLFRQPINERAQETGVSTKTISRTVRQFEQYGLPGFRPRSSPRADDARLLPEPIQQHIVALKAEHPPLTTHEIATICDVKFDRRLNYRTVARVLARATLPIRTGRRYPLYKDMPAPEERREAMLRLHLDGWSVKAIVAYLQVSRRTVHTFLRRWVEEGTRGLADKSRARTQPRKATLPVTATIKRLQEQSAIGAFRMHAALKQRGIELSPATCGRIMALNRRLYTLPPLPEPSRAQREKKSMPFAATRRHEYWSVDIRYIEHHQVPGIDSSLYIITILDNYSRGAPRTRRVTLTEAGTEGR